MLEMDIEGNRTTHNGHWRE